MHQKAILEISEAYLLDLDTRAPPVNLVNGNQLKGSVTKTRETLGKVISSECPAQQ